MIGRSSNGIMLNPRAVAASAFALAFCLYLVYSWVSTKSSLRSGSSLKGGLTWKTHEFVDVPKQLLDFTKNNAVKIDGKEVNVNVDGQIVKIFYREAVGGSKKPTVVLLHGASSSSEIWVKIGTIQLIAAMGHTAIAIDLPGWAHSRDSQLKEQSTETFLAAFLSALSVHKPMLISASMSGRYVLPYIMKPNPTDCSERVGAFVALAPVHTQVFEHAEYHRCEIPTLISYGTKDVTLGLQSVGNLRNMPMSEIMPMEGAGHANYEERPAEWHQQLYNFMLAVERLTSS